MIKHLVHSHHIITLAIAMLLGVTAYSQNKNQSVATLKGSVTSLLNKQVIDNANIEVYYHKVDFTEDGYPIIGATKDALLITKVKTNALGLFTYNIPLRSETDYVFIQVTAPGKESITKNLIQLNTGKTIQLNLTLTPSSPTANEEKLIEEKTKEFNQQVQLEKNMDSKPAEQENSKKKVLAKNGSSSASDSVCSYLVPTSVFVSNLHNGYNGTASGNGYTGYIDFDLYVGGVVHGEIGGITTNLETKKAQAIAARTFSLNRHEQELPVNIGQAYHDTPTASSSLGSSQSSEQVILYNNQVIDAKYSARCNGDYTQSATEGTWSPYTTCNTYGNEIPYLLSVTCSGHINCSATSETPCCNAQISTSANMGYIYGHGVGMCQRGIEQFGEIYGWTACEMLTHYYTDVCIANTNCGNSASTLICDNAVVVNCDEIYHGPASSAASNVFSYGCNSWTETGPERVHAFTATDSGTLTATITNFTGDLDVYLLGSCDPSDCLGTVYSSEVVFEDALADSTYYIVVDADDGSGSAYDLLVTCNANTSINSVQNPAIKIYPNPSNGLLNFEGITLGSLVTITNLQGKIICSQVLKTPVLDIAWLQAGMYLITLQHQELNYKTTILKN